MERKEFQAWLSAVDTLSEAQKAAAVEILAGRPVGEASVAAIELGVDEDRCCPYCGTPGAVANGKARGDAALPLPDLQADLRGADGHAAVRPAPQGGVADLRRVSGRWRHGEGVGGTVRCRREHRLPLAASLP